jgi:hypothetical protein
MRRETTGVWPQPLRRATRNLARVRTKRMVSNKTKAALYGINCKVSHRREGQERTGLSYAKMARLDGECMTVQLTSNRTSATTFMRVMAMAIFSKRKRMTRANVT